MRTIFGCGRYLDGSGTLTLSTSITGRSGQEFCVNSVIKAQSLCTSRMITLDTGLPLMLDALAPCLSAVVVCSAYLRHTFAPKSKLLAAKTHVIFNGVNTDLFHLREDLREPKTIFFVGRFDPEKGVLQLVKAYARVLSEHPETKLIIGGTTGFGTHRRTPYVRQVEELARSISQNNGAQIQFTGYIYHDRDLPAWFQRATVFACPSLFQEPFGLVNAEAMACGTVVVGSERGGIPEVLGDTGYLLDPEDIEAFAHALSEVLKGVNAVINSDRRRASEH